ncbi:MAG: hypothetical protein KF688_18025 [Pirellulales bacterium]|nr:hypothetical protein [Pirellulales bacterium]
MEQVKPATVVCLGHSTATITDTSQQLPDVDNAHAAGARMVLLANIDSLGSAVWVSMDGEDAAVDRGVRLYESHRLELTLDDIRKIRVVAPPNTGCKLSASYFR